MGEQMNWATLQQPPPRNHGKPAIDALRPGQPFPGEGSHAMNPQPTATPATPITPEEIAALRDALAKATPGEWEFCDNWITVRFHGDIARTILKSDGEFIALAHNLAPKLLAALDAAEAQAVEFAWDAFNRNTEFVYVVNSALPRLRTLTLASESAAEYLAERGLLRKTGGRTWQRVEGGK